MDNLENKITNSRGRLCSSKLEIGEAKARRIGEVRLGELFFWEYINVKLFAVYETTLKFIPMFPRQGK
jgi:hypothetical protein